MNGLCFVTVLLLMPIRDLALSDSCSTIYLLHLAPRPTPQVDGWDRGLEVIPAGRVAVNHINSHPNLLQGLQLEIINIPSLPCAIQVPFSPFVDVISILTSSQQECIFGVIGLYCSSVASIISPPLNHPEFGFIQLTSATSPLLRNTRDYPYLYSVISSSEIYNDAALEMISSLNWSRVSVVFDYQQLFFRSSGMNFSSLIDSNPNITRITQVPLSENTAHEIESMFDELFKLGSRITYLAVPVEESGRIMCEAQRRRLIWPQFAYIFIDRTLNDILSSKGNCSQDEIMKAAEGVFFLQTKLAVSNKTTIVSGKLYEDYRKEYLEELNIEAEQAGINLTGNEYANTLYDQVWSFALALNDSMGKLDTSINNSFINIFHQIGGIRATLGQTLRNISFQGASGYIQYGSSQEAQSNIAILQVRNGSLVPIGTYYSSDRSLIFDNDSFKHMVPPDSFETIRYRIPWEVGAVVFLIECIVLALVVTSIISVIYWRKQSEIKSTSIYVSLTILTGCLILCLAPLVRTIVSVFEVSMEALNVLCNMDLWFTIPGLTLIIASLLFRLLRVARVFSSYHPTGKYWSDKYVINYIIATTSASFLFLTIWMVVDPLKLEVNTKYQSQADLPFFLQFGYCSSSHLGIWVPLWFSWIAVLLFVVIFLAIQTRKIKRKHFKDTKKVNIFAFGLGIILALFIPLSYFLEQIDLYLWAYLFKVTADLATVLLCQILLFLPKYLPLMVGKKKQPNIKSGLGQVLKSFDSSFTPTKM